jgi:HSP20 family protein
MSLLTNWDPFSEMYRLQEEIGRRRGSDAGKLTFRPAVDIHEDAEAITLTAEVPGMKPDDIKVEVENDILTLSGERKLEHEENKENYHRIERSYGSFTRSFSLPDNVDTENVHAEKNDGVLTIKLMKKEKPAAKRIAVKG